MFLLLKLTTPIFNYNLISICETSLIDTEELPETLLTGYTFMPANNPANIRHGGVGLFHKNSLNFGRKCFFTVLYRAPTFNHTSSECQAFLANFENLYSKIKAENPFAVFLQLILMHIHSFGCQMATTPEGTEIEELISKLSLSQLISEPTNFEPYKNPYCIDLVVTDQPNFLLDSRTRASLDQIVHCKVNFRTPPTLPFERKIWHFNRANQAFHNNKSFEVRTVFLDISRAFDKVWHDGLIFKLEQNGITGNLLRLLQNYLSNIKQRVVLNCPYSDYSSI